MLPFLLLPVASLPPLAALRQPTLRPKRSTTATSPGANEWTAPMFLLVVNYDCVHSGLNVTPLRFAQGILGGDDQKMLEDA